MFKPLIGVVGALTPALMTINAQVFEYVLAANGLFIRAERVGLKVCIPLQSWPSSQSGLRGLHLVKPSIQLLYPRISQDVLATVLQCSRSVATDPGNPLEALFYLRYSEHIGWELIIPEQKATPATVTPLDSSAYADTLIEIHSHHYLKPIFSTLDNADEQGFRLYGVIGEIFERPTFHLRIGVWGHFWSIPTSWVFDLPKEISCFIEKPELHDCRADFSNLMEES